MSFLSAVNMDNVRLIYEISLSMSYIIKSFEVWKEFGGCWVLKVNVLQLYRNKVDKRQLTLADGSLFICSGRNHKPHYKNVRPSWRCDIARQGWSGAHFQPRLFVPQTMAHLFSQPLYCRYIKLQLHDVHMHDSLQPCYSKCIFLKCHIPLSEFLICLFVKADGKFSLTLGILQGHYMQDYNYILFEINFPFCSRWKFTKQKMEQNEIKNIILGKCLNF